MTRTWNAVLARLGVPTGDGRIIDPAGGSSRDLPLPLMFQQKSEDGHGGSQVVGRIETLRIADGMVTATGSMLDAAYGTDVIELLEAGVVGPSVDLDDIEYVMGENEQLVITRWRVAGATLVSIPAFADVSLTLDPLPAEPVGEPEPSPMDAMWASALSELLHTYERSPYSGAGNCTCGMGEHSFVHPHEYAAAAQGGGCVCSKPQSHPVHTPGLTASAAPEALPPADWFQRPDVDRLTPLTVTDTGRVFGHIAGWDTCHVGLPGCVTPPSSPTGYTYFHVAEQCTQDGAVLPVGTLVAGPRHADAQLAFRAAQEHYDDPSAAVARVVAGEDEHGIWVAGWLLPGASAEALDVFKSSPVSGDWRRVGGALELIGVCSVNTPGFPVPRARVAFGVMEPELYGARPFQFGYHSKGVQKTLIASFGVTPQQGEYLGDPSHARLRALAYASQQAARAKWDWAIAATTED